MTKAELRKEYKAKRLAIDGRERLRLDDLLLLQFQQISLDGIRTVLTYWPATHLAEPNMHLINGYLRHTIPDLQLCFTVMQQETNTLIPSLIDENTVYHTVSMGITEPKEIVPIDPHEMDLVLVPMLVCDQVGYRVGYGKGYYDRFLSTCREDLVRLGLGYFEPIERIQDTHRFDVPLTHYLTPSEFYEF